MALLLLGLALFLGAHSVRMVADHWRTVMIARISEKRWKLLCSVVSLVGLGMIIWGYGAARGNTPRIWTPPSWGRHATLLLMLASTILFAGSGFKRSGISVVVHHPMLVGVAAFGLGHLLANGSLADLVLFGALLVWSVADLISNFRRDRHHAVVCPQAAWPTTAANIGAGVAMWVVIVLWLHLWVIGVSPLS